MNVAVIGASDKSDRFSYQAVMLLKEKGHAVYPVHQRIEAIEGMKVYKTIINIPDSIDTVTLYVAADISSSLANDILSTHPKRIIFNPGAENVELEALAEAKGIECVNGCTLVMLRNQQF